MATVELNRTDWAVGSGSTALEELRSSLGLSQQKVLDHPIYRELNTLEDLITFTEFHVFAVWDFMLLLKWLQRRFTGVELPWIPPSSNVACRLVNEIVLAEESDEIGEQFLSHFELYVGAMEDLGADTRPIRDFLQLLVEGVSIPGALERAHVPPAAAAFVKNTWQIVEHCDAHEIAAAFALTRENLIPQMFERVIDAEAVDPARVQRFVTYLERHIEIDADEHTPMAFELLNELCGDDVAKWNECAQVSRTCFQARVDLWSGVLAEIETHRARRGDALEVIARLELPALVSLHDLELIVKGERLQLWSRTTPEGGVSRCRFELVLPVGVGAPDVSAAIHDGILEVRVPRASESASVTRIEVLRARAA